MANSIQTLIVDTTTLYHYDLMGLLITETDAQGELIKDYLWQGMMSIAQINHSQDTEQILYLYSDHLMTNRLATNATQHIVWRWEGEAFGNTPAQELIGISVNLRFPGQYFDEETNLHYNHFRYYDPTLGRYITSDPIGLKGGLNTYGYAGVNPIVYIDRLGLVTSVITVRDFGFGVHSAVHVDNGTDGLPILYDPSGSYTPSSGEPVGSGEMLFNENANLQDYIKFHEQLENTTVEVTKLPTTPKQERDIAKRAENLGGSPLGGFCTLQTSVAIGGVCGIGLSFFPSSLAKDAANAECK